MTISEVAILETKDDERDERRGAVVCGSSTVQSDWQSDAVGTGQDSTSRGTTKLYKCMYVCMCMEDEASHIRYFCVRTRIPPMILDASASDVHMGTHRRS